MDPSTLGRWPLPDLSKDEVVLADWRELQVVLDNWGIRYSNHVVVETAIPQGWDLRMNK